MQWFRRIGDVFDAFFRKLKGQKFLCDTCKYDYGNACWRPERPNATSCPDYRRRK